MKRRKHRKVTKRREGERSETNSSLNELVELKLGF